ncbi:MAG: hypothetical protein AB7G17_11680 [Phycisphaerales bacterium]
MGRAWIRAAALALVWVAAGVASLSGAEAVADKLHLKDGRVIEGTVQREGDGFVYFITKIGGIEKVELFLRDDILRVEKDGEAPARTDVKSSDARAGDKPASGRAASNEGAAGDGAVRVAFISMGEPPLDMVGPYMNASALRESIKRLEPSKPDIVVLVFNSGGGAAIEVQKLSDVVQNDLKPKYRTVAWIHSAISAAAMTAHACNEIYFMSKGNYGACTAFSMQGGRATAAEGRFLEELLFQMEKISARGGYNPLIMRAMQIEQELSCDIDENGVVHWRADLNGQHVVNPKGKILTFNSRDAIRYKFAKGVADTKPELMSLLVGDSEWVEVGQEADRYQAQHRESTHSAELSLNDLFRKLSQAVQSAITSASNAEERGRQVGIARRWLGEIRALSRRSPAVQEYYLGERFFTSMEEMLSRIAAGEAVNPADYGFGQG